MASSPERQQNTRDSRLTPQWAPDPERPRIPPTRPAPNSPPAPWQLDDDSAVNQGYYVTQSEESLSPVRKRVVGLGQGVMIVLVAAAAAILVIEVYPQVHQLLGLPAPDQ